MSEHKGKVVAEVGGDLLWLTCVCGWSGSLGLNPSPAVITRAWSVHTSSEPLPALDEDHMIRADEIDQIARDLATVLKLRAALHRRRAERTDP